MYYARRLRSLRPSEPFQRLKSSLRHWKQRWTHQWDPLASSPERLFEQRDRWLLTDGRPSLASSVRDSVKRRLPGRWWQDPGFWEAFGERCPAQAEQTVLRAQSLSKGKFTLFQWKEIDAGDPVRWSNTLDETRPDDEWPADFYADIPFYHDAAAPERDVKWCWELNRFQHLLPLAASWRLTGDQRFAEIARGLLEHWIRTVRYPFGVQWSSNLEVALRALSWSRCHVLCMDADSWDEEFMKRFLPCLYLHGRHIEQELSLHHAETNHLLGEASALVHLGMVYEPFKDATRWLSKGRLILERLVPRLILPDGVYAEQSTGYFRFVCEFLLPLIHLAVANDVKIPPVVIERLDEGLRFVKTLAPDPREIPMIGDADNGTAIGWQLSDYWDFSALFVAGSALLGDAALSSGIEECPAEAFLLGGPVLLEGFTSGVGSSSKGLPRIAQGQNQGYSSFPQGGYFVSRDARFNVVFDAGPLGIYPGFGHGHADALSFILHYRGFPALVDPGTFLYNGPPFWRDYFRGTSAHNTVSVDGQSQSTPAGTFRWARPLKVRMGRVRQHDGVRIFSGVIHWSQIAHERVILHVLDQGLVILDFLRGTGLHTPAWFLHWSPLWQLVALDEPSSAWDSLLEQLERNEIIPGGGSMSFAASAAMEGLDVLLIGPERTETVVLRGSVNPTGGWYSRFYGFKESISTLRSTVECDLPACLVTAIKPCDGQLEIPPESLALIGTETRGLL